jgi:hypothetical protein
MHINFVKSGKLHAYIYNAITIYKVTLPSKWNGVTTLHESEYK